MHYSEYASKILINFKWIKSCKNLRKTLKNSITMHTLYKKWFAFSAHNTDFFYFFFPVIHLTPRQDQACDGEGDSRLEQDSRAWSPPKYHAPTTVPHPLPSSPEYEALSGCCCNWKSLKCGSILCCRDDVQLDGSITWWCSTGASSGYPPKIPSERPQVENGRRTSPNSPKSWFCPMR